MDDRYFDLALAEVLLLRQGKHKTPHDAWLELLRHAHAEGEAEVLQLTSGIDINPVNASALENALAESAYAFDAFRSFCELGQLER